MKIFKWRIYPSSRIDKIVQMIGEGADDRELAKELLVPTKKVEEQTLYPKYRIRIDADKLYLEYKDKSEDLWYQKGTAYWNGMEKDKEYCISLYSKKVEDFKKRDEINREKAKFKEYTINF